MDIREFTTSAANSAWKWWAGEASTGGGDGKEGRDGRDGRDGEGKERSERLLAEQDQAPTEEEERAKIQRKCTFLPFSPSSLFLQRQF